MPNPNCNSLRETYKGRIGIAQKAYTSYQKWVAAHAMDERAKQYHAEYMKELAEANKVFKEAKAAGCPIDEIHVK